MALDGGPLQSALEATIVLDQPCQVNRNRALNPITHNRWFVIHALGDKWQLNPQSLFQKAGTS